MSGSTSNLLNTPVIGGVPTFQAAASTTGTPFANAIVPDLESVGQTSVGAGASG